MNLKELDKKICSFLNDYGNIISAAVLLVVILVGITAITCLFIHGIY